MRFDTPVYFQRIEKGAYQPHTGDYGPDTVTEVKVYASITTPGTDTLTLLYGELKQGVLTIRLQMPYTEPFDRIRIGDRSYRVDRSRRLRWKHTFIVSEVQ